MAKSQKSSTSTELPIEELKTLAESAEISEEPAGAEHIPPGIQTPVDDVPGLELDPAKIRSLAVKVLRSVVFKVNQKLNWTELPDEAWAEQTIEAGELLYAQYFGGTGKVSPATILAFNVLGGWVAPNVADKVLAMAAAEEPAAAAPIEKPV